MPQKNVFQFPVSRGVGKGPQTPKTWFILHFPHLIALHMKNGTKFSFIIIRFHPKITGLAAMRSDDLGPIIYTNK